MVEYSYIHERVIHAEDPSREVTKEDLLESLRSEYGKENVDVSHWEGHGTDSSKPNKTVKCKVIIGDRNKIIYGIIKGYGTTEDEAVFSAYKKHLMITSDAINSSL